jgi:hypothetical protein
MPSPFLSQGALDRLDLPSDAPDPIQQFELFALGVRHVDTSLMIGYPVPYIAWRLVKPQAKKPRLP